MISNWVNNLFYEIWTVKDRLTYKSISHTYYGSSPSLFCHSPTLSIQCDCCMACGLYKCILRAKFQYIVKAFALSSNMCSQYNEYPPYICYLPSRDWLSIFNYSICFTGFCINVLCLKIPFLFCLHASVLFWHRTLHI